jgi:DNA-directed RNA polymerase specialized sigma24 family protein
MISRLFTSSNHFTDSDHLIVRQAMALLPKRELEVVTLRFWEGLSETEISVVMKTDWRTVERLMTRALSRLRGICLSRPEFSRNKTQPEIIRECSVISLSF